MNAVNLEETVQLLAKMGMKIDPRGALAHAAKETGGLKAYAHFQGRFHILGQRQESDPVSNYMNARGYLAASDTRVDIDGLCALPPKVAEAFLNGAQQVTVTSAMTEPHGERFRPNQPILVAQLRFKKDDLEALARACIGPKPSRQSAQEDVNAEVQISARTLGAAGGRKASERRWGPSRERAIQLARSLWADNPDMLIGTVRSRIMADLIAGKEKAPEDEAIIQSWLTGAAEQGLLEIPPAARRAGRPKKSP